jgi:peptide/nickel transport system permease protein
MRGSIHASGMAELVKPAGAVLVPASRQRSLWRDVARRLVGHTGARIGFVLVALLLLGAALADVLARGNPNEAFLRETLKPPFVDGHLMGTDDLGRDVFTRVLYGARTSLRVGVVAVGIAVVFGSVIGFTAGFFGKRWDAFVMRVMDVVLSFPTILLAIAIVALRGPGIFNTMLAVGIVAIPVYARISRASAISLRGHEFVTAARAVGVPEGRILLRHIVPNSLSPLIVQTTLGVATAILNAAALGFLGLGAQPPDVEWGAMLVDSIKFLFRGAWWALTFPGMAIMITVIGFNLIGDGLRDSLDVRLRS